MLQSGMSGAVLIFVFFYCSMGQFLDPEFNYAQTDVSHIYFGLKSYLRVSVKIFKNNFDSASFKFPSLTRTSLIGRLPDIRDRLSS